MIYKGNSKKFIVRFLFISFIGGMGFSLSAYQKSIAVHMPVSDYFVHTPVVAKGNSEKNPQTQGRGTPRKTRQFSFSVTLVDNVVDLSSVIQTLEEATDSHYNETRILEHPNILNTLDSLIQNICKKSNTPEACVNQTRARLERAIDGLMKELSERVFYPDGYKLLGSANPPDYFPKAAEALNSNCVRNCSDNYVAEVIHKGSQKKYQQLYDKIKNKDKKCQRDILTGLAGRLANERFPKRCRQEEHKNHVVCESMLKNFNLIQGRISDLMKLVYDSSDEETLEATSPCLSCLLPTDTYVSIFGNLFGFLPSLQEQNQCRSLKPGEEKIVHSGTGLNQSYIVKREEDGSYSIPLHIRFLAGPGYDIPIPENEMSAYYVSGVQKCINKANQKLLGPKGERLKIIINGQESSSSQNNCSNNITDIQIKSKDYRSTHLKYESDIMDDCPLITHEILHLLGLCDEYKEKTNGHYVNAKTGDRISRGKSAEKKNISQEEYEFHLDDDCRVITINSIMSSHWRKWESVFVAKRDHSLLSSGQFNSILYGGCRKKNRAFNECSQLAYKSSVEFPDCLKKKHQCKAQNAMGLNKREELAVIQNEMLLVQDKLIRFRESGHRQGLDSKARADYDRRHKQTRERLRDLRKMLKTVRSWPD